MVGKLRGEGIFGGFLGQPVASDWNPGGLWFKSLCGHDKISTAVGPLSKALNPTLLQGGIVGWRAWIRGLTAVLIPVWITNPPGPGHVP